MKLLAGHRVLALGTMPERPLARYLATLGAEIVAGGIEDAGGASFLIEDQGLALLAAQGWSREAIEAAHPALVHVSVTTFGSFGPRAAWRGGELVAAAMGGVLRLTGQRDLPPVKEALDACTFHAEMIAAAGAMAAHHARAVHGMGQHVDISIQEATFNRNLSGVIAWQFDRRRIERAGGALNYGFAPARCIWPLADGYCFHALMTGRFGAPANQALSDWIDEVGLPNPLAGVDWLAYNRSTLDPAVRRVWEAGIEAFFASRTKAEIAGEGRRRGINACVVATPADVLADPHLAAREFWEAGQPRRFVAIREGAPASATAAPRSEPARPGPLAGVRVLDFSWALVGSITSKTLGDLGAEVIKVESRTRPCLSRIDVQVAASKPGNFDDKPWFAHLNTSKKSLALDMKQAGAREILNPLIEWADVVVENFSPGTMAKLGLDYDRLAAVNPGVVMVSGSVYGQTGPLAQEWGVDGTGGALSGRTYLTGWPDRDPSIPGAVPYGDVILPFAMAATVAAALAARRESGRGCHIDASMYELCVQQMRGALAAAQRGETPERTGNAGAGGVRQGVFPTRGEDRWIAIAAADDAQWAALTGLARGEDIAGWTRDQEAHALMERLQAAGIAAGVVQDMEELVDRDTALQARGAMVTLDHPLLGPFAHMRTPIAFSRDAVAPYRAPRLGEHGAEVARGIAGISAERLAELEAQGVLQ